MTQRAGDRDEEGDDLLLALERAADDGWPDPLSQWRVDQSDTVDES